METVEMPTSFESLAAFGIVDVCVSGGDVWSGFVGAVEFEVSDTAVGLEDSVDVTD